MLVKRAPDDTDEPVNCIIIELDYDLPHGQQQAITWTIANMLETGPGKK